MKSWSILLSAAALATFSTTAAANGFISLGQDHALNSWEIDPATIKIQGSHRTVTLHVTPNPWMTSRFELKKVVHIYHCDENKFRPVTATLFDDDQNVIEHDVTDPNAPAQSFVPGSLVADIHKEVCSDR